MASTTGDTAQEWRMFTEQPTSAGSTMNLSWQHAAAKQQSHEPPEPVNKTRPGAVTPRSGLGGLLPQENQCLEVTSGEG
jgi:hypothetical protein